MVLFLFWWPIGCSHEFDAYCDSQPFEEPPYHEQMVAMQEMEEMHEATLEQQGAVEALQNLLVTLSAFILRDGVEGDYFFGLYDAIEVTKSNLAVALQRC